MDRIDKSKIPEEAAAEIIRKLLFPNKYGELIKEHDKYQNNKEK